MSPLNTFPSLDPSPWFLTIDLPLYLLCMESGSVSLKPFLQKYWVKPACDECQGCLSSQQPSHPLCLQHLLGLGQRHVAGRRCHFRSSWLLWMADPSCSQICFFPLETKFCVPNASLVPTLTCVYKSLSRHLFSALSRLFYLKWKWKKSLSRARLFVTPWTVACQAPRSTGFSSQEYWSGLPFPSPGDLPNTVIEPESPKLQADS